MWLASIKLDSTALHRWWDTGPTLNPKQRAHLGELVAKLTRFLYS